MDRYDYIITGTGASGLMLAYHMAMDSFFDQKQILLIDKELKNGNDHTWCFWEKGIGTWDRIVHKKWDRIFFGSDMFSKQIRISPYQYKLVKSADFYEFVLNILQNKTNFTIVQELVISVLDERKNAGIETDKGRYYGDKIFNSILLSSAYKDQKKYPVLNQHFLGWFVKTKEPVFNSETATFMDFTVDQMGNTRFMYVLPISETEALYEYTLFSEDILATSVYETEISKYLEAKGITTYTITEKEKGCIPMTCYEFRKQNSDNVLHIGTAGGWTKPSTGYTFHNASKKVNTLIAFIKKGDDLSKFEKRTRFWYYDLLLLDVLHKQNQDGAQIFSSLFQRNKTGNILKFLDEETSFIEELRLMLSMPAIPFIKMLFRRVFR